MNRVLFWDFDGTVTHSNRLWSKSLFRALEKQGLDAGTTIADIRGFTGQYCTWDDADKQHSHLKGEAWWEHIAQRFAAVYRKVGLSAKDAARVSLFVREELVNPANFVLYDDAIPVLQDCVKQGWRNVLVSNNYPEVRAVAETLGVAPYFEEMVISAEIGLEKPEKEIYEYALRLAGNPTQCFMIGDNPLADVAGAQQAGIPAILVHRQADCSAVAQFDELTEMMAFLRGSVKGEGRLRLPKGTCSFWNSK